MTSTITDVAPDVLDDRAQLDETLNYSQPGPLVHRSAFLAGLQAGRFPGAPQSVHTAAAALENLRQVQTSVRAESPELLHEFAARTATDLLQGTPLPDDFARSADLAGGAVDRLQRVQSALNLIGDQVHRQFAIVVATALPEIFAGLRDELGDVMAQLQPTATALDGLDITDAEAVADGTDDQRAALLALRELRTRYNRLREAQRAAIRAADITRPEYDSFSVGNRYDWRGVFSTGLLELRGGGPLGVNPRKSASDMLQLAALGDEVWLPTMPELAAAVHQVHPQVGGAQRLHDQAWSTVDLDEQPDDADEPSQLDDLPAGGFDPRTLPENEARS